MTNDDVIVVGGGVIGLAAALQCAMHGLKVTLIDAPSEQFPPASGARSGALVPAMGQRRYRPLGILQREALDLYPEWLASLEALSGTAVPHRTLEVHRCLLPTSSVERMEVERLGNGMEVDTQVLRGALRASLHRLGVTSATDQVLAIIPHQVGVVVKCASGQEREGQRVVACPGRYLPSLVIHSPDGTIFPPPVEILPDWGQMIQVRPQQLVASIIIAKGFTLVPKSDGSVWVTGAHRGDVSNPSEDREITAAMLHVAEAVLREQLSVEAVWSGIRPRRLGGIPFVDWHPTSPRLMLAVGHSSSGFLLAPHTAREVGIQMMRASQLG